MFIVCPSCSGPYRIAADQIAPLVQTACPHCEYRVILDFEAANEPSLREAGHQFAQGFESVEAYAAVYDHVTSKPDAQPREGVAAVAVGAGTQARATGTGTGNAGTGSGAPVINRPLQRAAEPAASSFSNSSLSASQSGSAQASSVRSAGSKTVLQVPSKKPVSMDPNSSGGGDSPSLSGASSMRAGRGVDIVDAPSDSKPESRPESEPAERKPPHTPPTANIVSSGPPPSESPTPPPEDIAAQSGSHPAKVPATSTKPAETRPAEIPPAIKPVETKSSMTIFIIIAILIIGVIIVLVMMNR